VEFPQALAPISG
jgi:hypothetical protein